MTDYDFKAVEKKWQERWEKEKTFEVKEDSKKKKFYALEMYPYPSGSGLHMGHAFNFTINDILARFKRMQGFNVLHPAGYDSFGLPAENAAIKNNTHPHMYTDTAISNFIRQQKAIGLSYDWTRKLQSNDAGYYKWNQFFFLQFLKKGLVYRKRSPANWCPKCNSVLANEQVHEGKCWVHKDTDVEIKPLEQWFIKTTAYAEELLKEVDTLDWPERIKAMQKNWIGKSEGSEIMFEINGEMWPIFTTRADTLMGVTFLVVSAQHPKLMELVSAKQKKEVEAFVKRIKSTSEKDAIELEKEGVFTGAYAKHPITGENVPVWAGNFVVADYGAGMVMAVPAHDQRDFEFAKKYKIPLKIVIEPITGLKRENEEFRRSIVAVVENPKTGKVISINWGPKLGGNLFIGGGMEEGEDPIKTAIREIQEETGYKNVKFVSQTEKIHHHYFAHSKNVARNIDAIGLYFKLEDEERDKTSLTQDEKGKFVVEWITKQDALNNVKDELHGLIFKQLVIGEAYTGDGILANSGAYDGLGSDEARIHITKELEGKKLAKFSTNYKLRDWLVSRQRYWGTPIPMIHCEKCGIIPVAEKDLPVLLPENVKFGEGNPLATNQDFVNVNCPNCKGNAKRETDTMDTFFDSSWYYLRFTDAHNKKEPFAKKNVEYWMPVDFYVGGAEHACMHLIYARFFTKALRDLGYVSFGEPFRRLFNQGMIHGEDGAVMSKSRGNVIDPLTISSQYGADALRIFLMSVAGPDKDFAWSSTGVQSCLKFINKIYQYVVNAKNGKSSKKQQHKINLALKGITDDFEYIGYNLAIIKLRGLFDSLEEEISKEDVDKVILMLAPFCPHIAEELWEKTGHKGMIADASWPQVDESAINEEYEKMEKALETTVTDIMNLVKLVKEKQGKEIAKVYLYTIPPEKDNYNPVMLSERTGKEVAVFAVNDAKKYDPQGKATKAKPGRPAIYLE